MERFRNNFEAVDDHRGHLLSGSGGFFPDGTGVLSDPFTSVLRRAVGEEAGVVGGGGRGGEGPGERGTIRRGPSTSRPGVMASRRSGPSFRGWEKRAGPIR